MKIDIPFLQTRPLSYSSLKHFRKSPRHYIQYLTEPRFTTEAFIVGLAFETLAFDEANFDKKFQVFIKATGTGSVAKNQESYAKAKELGITLLTAEQMETITAMKESLFSTEYVRPYLEGITKKQVKLQWTDKKTGIPFIGYSDFESDAFGEEWVIDLKVSRDADPDVFPRDAFKFEYNMQWATYSEGYHKMKYRFPYFAYLVVENVAPFNVSLFMIEGKTMEQDKEEWRNSVDAFKYCMDEDLFHLGYEFHLRTMPYFSMRRPGYYKPKYIQE